ncbi:variable surface protein Vir4, putative [Plasmodium vivax]|uniref:Variable surface protein Vir4, putative n=1 Tax=Plasmodium vivax (strain Salvador I) TaxID=126793 RepID=A5KCU2_PLAVS|nr:variable surface protein Vir4, putative [Plasmodium vivax]EDL42830.1 variable surface protein Vir4, putative [Plasmodium vivax]|eukprot:XP_001612614.1 variable surface protein Vir4 [Plasmodium vivax Sal-1]
MENIHKKFYDNLYDDKEDLDLYSKDCASVISLEKGNKVNNVCKSLVKYLKTKYQPPDKEGFAYNDCILLNYWVYNRLVTIYGSRNSPKFFPAWGKLVYIWNTIISDQSKKFSHNKCKPDDNIVNHVDWEKRKQLYDYCVNYETIKKALSFYDNMCKEYYTYVDSNAPLYTYFKTQCTTPNYKCPEFYNECEKYDPIHVLKNFPCHDVMKKEMEEDAIAHALHVKKVTMQDRENHSEGSSSEDYSSDPADIAQGKSQTATKLGDVLLGVVVTSMASGAIYRETVYAPTLETKLCLEVI